MTNSFVCVRTAPHKFYAVPPYLSFSHVSVSKHDIPFSMYMHACTAAVVLFKSFFEMQRRRLCCRQEHTGSVLRCRFQFLQVCSGICRETKRQISCLCFYLRQQRLCLRCIFRKIQHNAGNVQCIRLEHFCRSLCRICCIHFYPERYIAGSLCQLIHQLYQRRTPLRIPERFLRCNSDRIPGNPGTQHPCTRSERIRHGSPRR